MGYVPKHKLKLGGKVPGKLIDPSSGRQFLGKFVQDYKGNYFKGSEVTSKSEPLLLVKDADAEEKALGLRTVYVKPTPEDYSKGTFIRYFVGDSRSKRVIEVDKPKYLEQKKESKLYRKTLKINWYIKGELEDQTINGYIYPGVKAKNQDVIDQAEKQLPGIGTQALTDPTQFVKK
jgi:hypothetical protein